MGDRHKPEHGNDDGRAHREDRASLGQCHEYADGLAGGLGKARSWLGGGLKGRWPCASAGLTLDEGGTWVGADPDVGDGERGADGGTYGGAGSAGRVGVLAKSCSETGGRPASSTWPLIT